MYINILLLISKLLTSLLFIQICESSEIIENKNEIIKYDNYINKWKKHEKMILKIKDFQIDGEITYKNGIKRIFLNFCWDNMYPKYFNFRGYTFFGIKLIEFMYNQKDIYFKNYGMKPIIENNPQFLFERVSKTNIPIRNLRSWLIGLPGDSKEFILDDFGCLKEVQYINNNKNYKIIYNKYNTNFNPPLPENIELHEGSKKIILKIKNWNFLEN